MRGCSESDTLRNGILQAENLHQSRADDIAKHSGNDDYRRSQSTNTAGLFTENHTNGGCDALGQQ